MSRVEIFGLEHLALEHVHPQNNARDNRWKNTYYFHLRPVVMTKHPIVLLYIFSKPTLMQTSEPMVFLQNHAIPNCL